MFGQVDKAGNILNPLVKTAKYFVLFIIYPNSCNV